jgi:hypothetical protein
MEKTIEKAVIRKRLTGCHYDSIQYRATVKALSEQFNCEESIIREYETDLSKQDKMQKDFFWVNKWKKDELEYWICKNSFWDYGSLALWGLHLFIKGLKNFGYGLIIFLYGLSIFLIQVISSVVKWVVRFFHSPKLF